MSSVPRSSVPRRLVIAVVAALLTILPISAGPAAAADTGAVSGSLSDAGTPVPGATVALLLSVYPVAIATTTTGADGTFRLSGVTAGSYKLRFTMPGGLQQFYPEQTDFNAATVITVADGQEVTVAESVIAHGSLSGRITTATGQPAGGALVGITGSNGLEVAHVIADANGAYLLPFVAAGTFHEFVAAAEHSAPRQWVHQHKSATDADPVVVTLSRRTVVDEALLPLGTIAGHFSNAAGPIAGAVVYGYSQTSDAESVSAPTQPDGSFQMYAYPGTYKVKFTAPAGVGLDQWASGKESERAADVITVTAGAATVLEEHALPTGKVSGHLTDADGKPVEGAAAVVRDPVTDREFVATTDADGAWFLTAWTGSYVVSFETQTQVQWAHGASSPDAATRIAVTSEGNTVVDEALTVPGSLSVTAVDAATGAPLSSFCATPNGPHLFLPQACTQDGTVTFRSVGAGTEDVLVSDGVHLDATVTGVRIAAGQHASATARLRLGATVVVDVVDAGTGAPVDACVNAIQTTRAPSPGEGVGDCSYDGSGHITLSRIRPEPYALFASPYDGVHGDQWVGPRGGVGSRAAARVVNPGPGGTAHVTVRLDGSGSITGTVTDRSTGAPVAGATVTTWTSAGTSDANGHYSLDGLGPYRWSLFFSDPSYAAAWSPPVDVRVGRASTYNQALAKGVPLTRHITGAVSGRAPDSATVDVVNARTFDVVSHVDVAADGSFTAHVLPFQDLRLLVNYTIDGCTDFSWYPGSTVAIRVPERCAF